MSRAYAEKEEDYKHELLPAARQTVRNAKVNWNAMTCNQRWIFAFYVTMLVVVFLQSSYFDAAEALQTRLQCDPTVTRRQLYHAVYRGTYANWLNNLIQAFLWPLCFMADMVPMFAMLRHNQ